MLRLDCIVAACTLERQNLIELENITKNYTVDGVDVSILKGISLFIGHGEFVSIMSPSGSGKSTLSAILGCLSTATKGTYKINGEDVTKLSHAKIARLRNSSIGFIFQDFNLLSGLSALDNVALPLVYGGMNARDRRSRAMECLNDVGLAHKAKNLPSQLSGGQKQRVAIARALVNNPKFLFADEPTGALDKTTGGEILGIIQRLNMRGHTVIQVTHSRADAQYSKRILHLVDGNIGRDETVDKPTMGTSAAKDAVEGEETASRLWRVVQQVPAPTARDLKSIGSLISKSLSRESQLAAVKAIGRWGNAEIENAMAVLIHSPDWVVRAEVIKYANQRSGEKSLDSFFQGLADENAWVRHSAIIELKKVEQASLTPEQQECIIRCTMDHDERVRATTISIIGKWQLPNIQDIFIRALHDSDGRVRGNAIESVSTEQIQLSLLDELLALVEDKHNRVRANAIRIVATHRPEIAERAMLRMLTEPSPLMRSSAAWLVGVLQIKSGGEFLLQLLKTEKEELVVNQVIKSMAMLTRDIIPLHVQIERMIGPQEARD